MLMQDIYYGNKMKIEDHHQMADFRSVVAVTGQYVTAELFLSGDYDLRIQYISEEIA